jgi:hypothetical protein
MEEHAVLHRLNSAATLIQITTTDALDGDYELYRTGRTQEDDQLRSLASARRADKGSPADAASDRSGQEEER